MTEHRGAIEMGQTELDEGANPQALALVEKVVDDQAGVVRVSVEGGAS